MKNLLIVANTPSNNTHRLAQSVLSGASRSDIDNVQTRLLEPLQTHASDLLQADALIIGTTENFAYMSGQIKDFFERVYYPCLEQTQGLPYALYVRAGNDGSNTVIAVNRIITGLRWKAVQPTLLLKGDYQPSFSDDCHELGLTMAAGLEAGIF